MKVVRIIKKLIFYLLNKNRYKKLGFRSYISKPLRITGKKYISIGEKVQIRYKCWFNALKLNNQLPVLEIGDGCVIGDFSHIAAVKKVVISKNVLTAQNIFISDHYHGYEEINIPIIQQAVKFKSEVFIGEGTWLGENVCVIGARIGRNCVIGANSVVTKDIPDYSVAVGFPAKVIKKYNSLTNKWERSK